MALTKLDVFNGALITIGHKVMDHENEDSPQGQACRQFYPVEYETLLNIVAWPFAYKSAPIDPAWDTSIDDTLASIPENEDSESPAGLAWDTTNLRLFAANGANLNVVDFASGQAKSSVEITGWSDSQSPTILDLGHDGAFLVALNDDNEIFIVNPTTGAITTLGAFSARPPEEDIISIAAETDTEHWYAPVSYTHLTLPTKRIV